MTDKPRVSHLIERIDALRNAWEGLPPPNNSQLCIDIDRVDAVFSLSRKLNSLENNEMRLLAEEIKNNIAKPDIDTANCSFSELNLYWIVSEFKDYIGELIVEINGVGENVAGERLIDVTEYRKEILFIKESVASINNQLNDLKKSTDKYGRVSVGALGVSVPVATIASTLTRIKNEIEKSDGKISISAVAKSLKLIFDDAKSALASFIGDRVAAPVVNKFREILDAAGRASLVAFRIMENETAPPNEIVQITFNPDTTIEEFEGTYQVLLKTIDDASLKGASIQYGDFGEIQQYFRRFMFCVSVDRDKSNLHMAQMVGTLFLYPRTSFETRIGSIGRRFNANPHDVISNIRRFIIDLNDIRENNRTNKIDISRYGMSIFKSNNSTYEL